MDPEPKQPAGTRRIGLALEIAAWLVVAAFVAAAATLNRSRPDLKTPMGQAWVLYRTTPSTVARVYAVRVLAAGREGPEVEALMLAASRDPSRILRRLAYARLAGMASDSVDVADRVAKILDDPDVPQEDHAFLTEALGAASPADVATEDGPTTPSGKPPDV